LSSTNSSPSSPSPSFPSLSSESKSIPPTNILRDDNIDDSLFCSISLRFSVVLNFEKGNRPKHERVSKRKKSLSTDSSEIIYAPVDSCRIEGLPQAQ
jgi:hypothetical protein